MTEPNKVTLTHPVIVGGREVNEVVFQRPKAKRMALLAQMDGIRAAAPVGADGKPVLSKDQEVEITFLMIRAVTGWSDDDVGEIDLFDDFPVVGDAAASFLESIAPQQPDAGAA